MAHSHDAVHGAEISCDAEDSVEKRDKRGDAFKRKTLRAEVAGLQNLLEKVCANQPLKNSFLVDLQFGPLDAFRDPPPSFWLGEVHEFHANVAAVDAARFFGSFARQFQIGKLLRLENAEWVQRSLVIAPAPENVKNALALF